jgi:hypothetical protein
LKYEDKLDWETLTRNPNITWDIIKENLDKPWEWDLLSCNENITFHFLKENLSKEWDWELLSELKYLKEKDSFMEMKMQESSYYNE